MGKRVKHLYKGKGANSYKGGERGLNSFTRERKGGLKIFIGWGKGLNFLQIYKGGERQLNPFSREEKGG